MGRGDQPAIYVGLMSGTSLDGVDAVVAHLKNKQNKPEILASAYHPLPAELKDELLKLQDGCPDEIHRAALAANRLAFLYAETSREAIKQAGLSHSGIRAIGCHGQTIRHRPGAGYTIQLNNPALLAELTQITVVADFRSRDIAAGGQGAPLVPAFHAGIFGHTDEHRVILNLGGMANITHLPPQAANRPVSGFDTGPGNVLLDAWIQHCTGQPYDDDGQWAASGQWHERLLQRLLALPFFAKAPPKSCGREEFNLPWLLQSLTDIQGNIPAPDVQATLLELTARSSAKAIQDFAPGAQALYLCGGGARNRALTRRIGELLPGMRIETTDAFGIGVDQVEALAFAWLAQQTLAARPGNLPEVTGASGARILGAIYPA